MNTKSGSHSVDGGTTSGSQSGSAFRNLHTFASLKNRNYRFFFVGMTGLWASTSIQNMTNALLIYDLTGSVVLLGTLAIVSSLPILLFSIFGGVIADRFRKKYVLLVSLGLQAAISLAVALALISGYMSSQHVGSWWVLIVSSFLQGLVTAFMMPAQRAVIPEIVAREIATNAIALNNMGQNVLKILAPAPSGFLIDAFGYPIVFLIMTLLYLLGVVCVAFIPLTGKVAAVANPLTNVKEGFSYMWRENILFFVVLWSFCGQASLAIFTRLMPIFANDILKVGATGMGVWQSVSGAGAIISSLIFASLKPRMRGFTHVSASMLHAAATVLFCFNRSWYASLVLMFFQGFGVTTGGMMSQSLLQDYSEDDYRGRVFGVHVMVGGPANMAAFPIAFLAAAIGAPWAVGSSSLAIIALGILTLVFNRRYRRLA